MASTPTPRAADGSALPLRPPPKPKPMVIGLYGISGCGKTFMLNELQQIMKPDELKHFKFYEGSEVIDSVTPGGLEAFIGRSAETQEHYRERAIERVRNEAAASGLVAVVTGHYMFWPEDKDHVKEIITPLDCLTYTHIIYLDVPADLVAARRRHDDGKTREHASLNHLRKWQQTEKEGLREVCRKNGIVFLSLPRATPANVATILNAFREGSEETSLLLAKTKLNDFFEPVREEHQLRTMLVMDGDKTLCAQDTGSLFWQFAAKHDYRPTQIGGCPLDLVFGGQMGYSYTAFLQAMCMYEEVVDFEHICGQVTSVVTLHPEFVALLKIISRNKHVGAVVITCGLRQVWERVLSRYELTNVLVLGSGCFSNKDFVITPDVKAGVVKELNDAWKIRTWAFGDSPLDIPMMKEAYQAIVVVGGEWTRSQSMDEALLRAIKYEDLSARQVLLPSNS